MKKALANTRVSVKLRKSEYREEWYLYVEAYPVFEPGKSTPQRVREYLNRTVTTPLWDKSRNARTDKQGKTTYKPKRDLNGIILCKSRLDQEACIYADKVRGLRQKEYDNASLYSETDAEQAEQLERSHSNFIEYFDHVQLLRHAHSSDSIIVNWQRVHELLKIFVKGDTILFSQIDMKFIEAFRMFMINAPQGGSKSGTISQNTASTYFSIFKAALKQAFIDGYFTVDISAKVKGIQGQESRREYLTVEELNRLAQTPCAPLLKRAALFSALTGLRHCDIQKLKWSEIEAFNGGYRLNFTQQKTKGVEYMPIPDQAYQLCGDRKDGELLVFAGLPDPSWISRPIKKWIEAAGIKKHITFHCFRHSYATLQLAGGTDIYTVSKMLGHTNVRTTQVYAKVVDAKKEEATKTIKLELPQQDN
nr:site-specific integrase [uncultured Bacteroides sp.]